MTTRSKSDRQTADLPPLPKSKHELLYREALVKKLITFYSVLNCELSSLGEWSCEQLNAEKPWPAALRTATIQFQQEEYIEAVAASGLVTELLTPAEQKAWALCTDLDCQAHANTNRRGKLLGAEIRSMPEVSDAAREQGLSDVDLEIAAGNWALMIAAAEKHPVNTQNGKEAVAEVMSRETGFDGIRARALWRVVALKELRSRIVDRLEATEESRDVPRLGRWRKWAMLDNVIRLACPSLVVGKEKAKEIAANYNLKWAGRPDPHTGREWPAANKTDVANRVNEMRRQPRK